MTFNILPLFIQSYGEIVYVMSFMSSMLRLRLHRSATANRTVGQHKGTPKRRQLPFSASVALVSLSEQRAISFLER